ncbi:MAG: anti-sigma factor [Anaerolineaceae bacterium]|nr:anti-sigma factor [Anaerolineaceae bacterium]
MDEPTHIDPALLNEYLDHALEPGQMEALERHLQGCEMCRASLNELRQLFSAIETLPEVRLERDLSAAIMTEIQRRPARQVPAWLNLAFLIQTGTAAAILAAAWPVISAGSPILSFSFSAGPFTGLMMEMAQFWSIQSLQFIQTIQQAGTQNLDWLRSFFIGDPSAVLTWATCLGITFFLWLVGNSLLLRSQKSNFNRRNS